MIGTIDMDAVFKNYEKVKVSSEEFKAAAMAKKDELMKIQAEAQQEGEMLAKLTPGTEDFKKHENKVTELKARFEAGASRPSASSPPVRPRRWPPSTRKSRRWSPGSPSGGR